MADEVVTDITVSDPAAAPPVVADPPATGSLLTDPPADKTAPVEPEFVEYTDFVTPEGTQIDEELLGVFKETSKNLKLNQEQAQAFMDLGIKQAQAIGSHQAATKQAEITAWRDATTHDTEIGGDKLTESLSVAAKAMAAFGGDALKTVLNETGLGNHPEIIRAFYKAGMQISEDKLLPGSGKPGDAGQTWQQKLYPNLK